MKTTTQKNKKQPKFFLINYNEKLEKKGRWPQKKMKKMEDDLKKIMENKLKLFLFFLIEDDMNKIKKWRRPKKKSFLDSS